ncbi:protein serine/threonine phosphatase 2C [Auriculariales sp. MPI-PUGE-AT-0066]|nr:protein serine/threonine phosphatase 2C [Auriculariales sp. MPI-PUGE-AT-0066]
MSKPSLRAVLPRPNARARSRTLHVAPFTSLHHAHIDAILPMMPPPRGQPVPSPNSTARLPSSGGSGSNSTSPQPDALSLLFDAPSFQAPSHSPPGSSQNFFGPTAMQIATPVTQPGPRLLPITVASSSLPASLAAMPPMSYYQQILATIPSNSLVPTPSKCTRAAFLLESAAYGIPKHRSRGMSSGPIASSSLTASSGRPFELPAAPALTSDPEMNLAVQVGEDAYFLLPNALGVSDGVGGWSQKQRAGSPPASSSSGPSASALFSRRLMHFCADEISALAPLPDVWKNLNPTAPSASTHPSATVPSQGALPNPTPPAAATTPETPNTDLVEPVAVLQRAYARAVALSRADHSLCGSSTALLAILLGDELRVAHLGDCALCLVRNGRMVFRSQEQQWKFNHPLQLGPFSSTVPGDAQRIALKVQPDDILILSSDGMSDNLWDEDVLDEVSKFTMQHQGSSTGAAAYIRKHAMPSMLSEALCSRAKRSSEVRPSRSHDSTSAPASEFTSEVPFARRAREEGIKFSGGKADDISVLVAVIAPRDDGSTAKNESEETAQSATAAGSKFSWPAAGGSPALRSRPLAPQPRLSTAQSNLTFLTACSSQ